MQATELQAFYRGKTVLVTGHTGFKGGWLAFWLQCLGARVIGFSLPPPEDRPSFFTAVGLDRIISSFFGDIREFAAVDRLFRAHQPEVVFHLAAQAIVRKSYRDPIETYASNVMGTAHLLEAARRSPSVRSVVIVTSDKCYENREWPFGYREVDPMGGRDPYSSSKGCAELVTAAYRSSYFENPETAWVASTRAGNVVGGGDWAEDRLVPDFIRAISSGSPLILRNPAATRPWQHVLDPLWGYLVLCQHLWTQGDAYAQAWNFGPSDDSTISVAHLAELLAHYWGKGKVIADRPKDTFHEARFLRLDCGKARSRLNWQPKLPIEKTLQMTVDWYRTFMETPDRIDDCTERQIDEHMLAG